MTFNPWQFTSPYIPYTKILAEQVNPNFNGISVSLQYVAGELNQFIPRLPDGFAGNNKIPVGPYHNTLLGIDENGDVNLFDKNTLVLAAGKALTLVKTPEAAIQIDGNSDSIIYYCEHSDADPEVVTAVTVGESVATVNGEPAILPGATVLFIQKNDNPLVFVEAPGVTVIPPKNALLKAFGRGCTVGLFAIDQYTWQLFGDLYLEEEVVE